MEELNFDLQFDDSNDVESVKTEDESSSSEESSDGIEEDKSLDNHIDQLTTDMVVDIAEKAGALVDADTASELKTTVMNRLRYVLMVALQFSHHENSPSLGFRDFERAEEAVLDTSGTRKMFSPSKDSERTIDLFKTVTHEKFNDIPVENLNPRFKVHCPNYFRYVQTDEDQDCEDCIKSNAGFEETDHLLITEEDLKCLSSSDEVECYNSDGELEQEHQYNTNSEDEELNEMNSVENTDENIENIHDNENQPLQDYELVKECAESDRQFNADESGVNGEQVIEHYSNNLTETMIDAQTQDTDVDNALISESIVNEEGYSVEENQDSFTEQLIATDADLNDSSSSTNRYLVHEYVDDEGNSYLVTQDSTIANSEGFISDSILTEQKPECDFENEQRVFEYTEEGIPAENVENEEGIPVENEEGIPVENEEGMPVVNEEGIPVENEEGIPAENGEGIPAENEDGYVAAVPVEETISSGHEEMICETTESNLKVTIVPTSKLIDVDDDEEEDEDLAEENFTEEIELDSSDEEVEFLNSEDEVVLENSDEEIEGENFEEEEPNENDEERIKYSEEVTLENPEVIGWAEGEEEEVELKITDSKYVWDNANQYNKSEKDVNVSEEIELEISDDEMELKESDEESESSEEFISVTNSDDEGEQNWQTSEKLLKVYCRENPNEYVEYVAVDVMVINDDESTDTTPQNFGCHKYLVSEVFFDDSMVKNVENLTSIEDLDMEIINLDNFPISESVVLENDKNVHGRSCAENRNEDPSHDKWQMDGQREIPTPEEESQLQSSLESYDFEDEVNDVMIEEDISEMNSIGPGQFCIEDEPDVDIEYNYGNSSLHYNSIVDTQTEYPDTEIELVESDREAELSDSDTEIVLQNEQVSAESDDSNLSIDSENSMSDSSSEIELEESESDIEFKDYLTLKNSKELYGDTVAGHNEYVQIQDFVLIENSTEASEYQIDYETLKLNVENINVLPPRAHVGTQCDYKKEMKVVAPKIETTTEGIPEKEAPSDSTELVKKMDNVSENSAEVKDIDCAVEKGDSLVDISQHSQLNEGYIIEFADIEDIMVFNDHETIKEPFLCFAIDEQNNSVALELNNTTDDLSCEATGITATVSESTDEIGICESVDETGRIFDESVGHESPGIAGATEVEEIEDSNLQGVVIVEPSDDTNPENKYDIGDENVDSHVEDMETVPATASIIIGSANTEATDVNDFHDNPDDMGQVVAYVTNVDPDASETISVNNEVIKHETTEHDYLTSYIEENGITSIHTLLQSHVTATEGEEHSGMNEQGSDCIVDVSDEGRREIKVEDFSASDSDDVTAEEVVLKRHSDDPEKHLIMMAAECVEDSDSSVESASEDDEEESFVKSNSKIAIASMPHRHPALPVEWKDYMKIFVSNFFRNTDIHTDEVDTEEFNIILQDIRIHGAFPVLDIICDFFLDFIRKKNELLECGEVLTTEMETSLGLISSTIKAVLDCPLDCSQMHLKLISSVLINLLTLPTPCKNQQGIIQSFLKVILRHEELLEWTKAYITETLQRTVEIQLRNIPEDTKCILGSAIELANGLETIGIHVAGEYGWEREVLVFCKRYDKLKSRPRIYKKYLSENDTYIEQSIFIFIQTLCSQYSYPSKLFSFHLRAFVNGVYGEQMTMYLNAKVNPNPTDRNILTEKPGSSANTRDSTCNVCFKPDKSQSSAKLFSKGLRRTGKERKYRTGNVMSLSVVL